MTPCSGARGVVSTFVVVSPPGVYNTTSVKVPPMSTASRAVPLVMRPLPVLVIANLQYRFHSCKKSQAC